MVVLHRDIEQVFEPDHGPVFVFQLRRRNDCGTGKCECPHSPLLIGGVEESMGC